ncbi:MAG: choice-of-anchor J domain-containing protein [Bacteroidaceae bacterium]|nr:choice-of-anchor J domain-containing protein [Bacteroidaceae bacterium]
MKQKTTLFTKASLTLFAVFFSFAGARAQQALPYEYGFEDNDLSNDGWVLQGATSSSTCIETETNAAHNGTHGFVFYYSEQNAYLISPLLTGGEKGINVSFYYGEYSNAYGDEQFQVGYTTDETVTDASEFTYGDIITASVDWQEYTSTFPAGTKRIAIKYIFGDHWYFYLDDFSFIGAEVPTNITAKDITTTSATISWTGIADSYNLRYASDESEWVTVNNVTSPYTIEGLTPGTTYKVQVQGVFSEGTSAWAKATTFTTLSTNPVPSNIEADLAADGAALTWEGKGDSYKVRYRVPSEKVYSFLEDFEGLTDGALPEGWIAIDSDADGNNWLTHTNTGSGNYNTVSGNGVAISASYDSETTSALTPDNWLITPKLTLKGTMSVWLCGQDASWAGEHFAIYLSTTGNDIADFTTVLVPESITTGNYVEYTADLSAYEGQEGYIAIRHFNITDMFWLDLDDFGLYETVSEDWTEVAVTDATATISGLATNSTYEYQIQSIKEGEEASEWSELNEFALVTLNCDGDNTDLINKFDGKFAHVTLANRTFFQDGTWNTIVLPFNLDPDQIAASPLADADVRIFEGSSVNDNTVTLNFTAEGEALTYYGGNTYYGGLPYIVKWTNGTGIENPAFANVTITNADYSSGDSSGDVQIQFYGLYDSYTFGADNTSFLFVGADNKLNYPLAGATIGATRGYFALIGVTAGEGSGAKQFVMNFGDEDPTAIANISSAKESSEWYDLNGRKLAGKPSMKGIYVNGGRKVTIK